MSLSREEILQLLRGVRFPGFDRDIVSVGAVREIRVVGGDVQVEIDPGPGNAGLAEPIRQAVTSAIEDRPGVDSLQVRIASSPAGSPSLPMANAPRSVAEAGGLDSGLIPQVRHTIAVASGKGGVGKSTVAANLAVALASQGLAVGLLDADIYGPSIPIMMGIDEQPELTPERKLIPFERFGVRLMSLGFLLGGRDQAVIWRGPMVMKAIEQLLGDVIWGELDILVVDMPPGTGDAQLTLSQKVQLAGAVIVTTPQEVALTDAVKGVAMFRKVGVPILGIVENMSYFACPHCTERSDIFGNGGGRREAERLGVPCLGQIPLDLAIRSSGDEGTPIVAASPDSAQSRAFLEIATAIRTSLQTEKSEGGGDGTIFDRFRKVWDPKR